MAELVLSNIGAAIGARVLPAGVSLFGRTIAGAAIGRTIGSIGGAALDAALAPRRVAGPRIRDLHVMESREGAGVPVVFGRMRVGGQVIWAARLKESVSRGGGKGGPRTAERSYTLSFAVGLCAGEAARVARAWADGERLDLSELTWRFYPGSETQAPDPLIEAVEGTDAAPAYRGLAYIVFEDMPVDRYGGRLPQLSFEVVRPTGDGGERLESMVRGINLIPGSGEFSLATDIVRRSLGPGAEAEENRHGFDRRADLLASLDEMEAAFPNLRRVNLVTAWFGDDLRCGACAIRPGVELRGKATKPWSWRVGPMERETAYLVSQTGGRANYGGTPADRSVIQAIRELKARSYHVTLYPFLLMDLPYGNARADPHGGGEQAAFPWRGRITCHPAPGQVGSPDGSAVAAAEVAAFFGSAQRADFQVAGETVNWIGPGPSGARDEGYRRFILHHAALAQAAGGVDGFLIGSELVDLTQVRDAGGGFPAVAALRTLAGEVKSWLGPSTEVSYAADWTEYGARSLSGGDLAFPLDTLWADPAIDYVGLDWYPPMGDWREGDGHADAGFAGPDDPAYLEAGVAGGEAFDWYYADAAGRAAQARLPITDGAYGEPWVYRQKDVRSWWSNAHHSRVSGVRSATPTGWIAGMKPVRFVEMGCPAVDKGANQPNVFFDPKSAESALPHFSSGARDDLIQRRAIEAFHRFWSPGAPGNPLSAVYGGPMTPEDGVAVWAWDARPFPAFPSREDVWSDGPNWRLGHWLNGRAGAALLPDVVREIGAAAGAEMDATQADGLIAGYGFEGVAPARSVLDPLFALHGLSAVERDGRIVVGSPGPDAFTPDQGDFVQAEGDPSGGLSLTRSGMDDGGSGVRLTYIDADGDYAPATAASLNAGPGGALALDVPVVLDRAEALRRADQLEVQAAAARESVRFELGPAGHAVEPGDVVALPGGRYLVSEVSEGLTVEIEARRISASGLGARGGVRALAPPEAERVDAEGEPLVVLVDAPALPGEEDDARPLAFAFSEPWTGRVTLSGGPAAGDAGVRAVIERPATLGSLAAALEPAAADRWVGGELLVDLTASDLASRDEAAVLSGANAVLVETAAGWELIRFAVADLVAAGRYRLTRLLRGQQGGDDAAGVGAPAGARVVVLNGAGVRLDAPRHEVGRALELRAWRRRPDEAQAWMGPFTHFAAALRAWAPAHLRLSRQGGGVAASWIRRARSGGDAWDAAEPPLEGVERYRVRVRASGGGLVREWETTDPSTTYPASEVTADFPGGGEIRLEVAMLGPDGAFGAATEALIVV
ncbi:hypothetical protein GC169_04895 [bacterium]|nr:hypothetical protein [bacterium]